MFDTMLVVVDDVSRVFISYAHGDKAHEADVARLHGLLRAGGVEAILDRDVEGPGMQWLSWMEEQVATCDFVLVIASPAYGRQAAAGVDIDDITGRGTWYEARLLRDAVYRDEGRDSLRRILPVLLPGTAVDHVPAFFAPYGGTCFRVRQLDHAGVANLLRVLRREPGTASPAGFEPLRHAVNLDVAVTATGLHCQVTVAGQPLGPRQWPTPTGMSSVWSVLDLDPLTAAGELAAAGERLTAALLEPQWLQQIQQIVDDRPVGAPVDVIVTSSGPGLTLPYELLRLPDQRVLATVAGVSFTRRVTGVDRAHPRPSAGPLKILAAVAAPTRSRLAPLDVEAEMQAIIDVTAGLGRTQVTILEVASPAQITAALRRDAYHVLHLSAHGSPDAIELEDEDGNAVPVDAQGLVEVLRGGGRTVPLLVLSSCAGAAGGDTGLAAALIHHGLHRVMAMQAPVTDRYATELLNRVYTELGDHNQPVSSALARARADLYHQIQIGQEQRRPEYATATLWTAGADSPLVDPSEPTVDLTEPARAPAGGSVRELQLGELIGRRAQLRQALRLLRDEPTAVDRHGANCGVALTGIGGIGKTALAGRVMGRLREDRAQPWLMALHVGKFSPPHLFAAVAEAVPDQDLRALLLDASIGDDNRLGLLAQLLGKARILLVFDDFEQNLTTGGDKFIDPAVGDLFAALCQTARRGKILVTCRYPVPGVDDLVTIAIPPLSAAELSRLLLRLPMLRDLAGADRKTIIDTIGGHPRLIEFVDALMRGQAGRGRMTEVAAKLRKLAGETKLRLAKQHDTAPDAAQAAQQAVLLGSRDILLDQLLDLLTTAQREILLQAALSRMVLPPADLHFAVHGTAEDITTEMRDDLDRLINLTLLAPVDGGLLVQTWVREALAPYQGEDLLRRHERAAAMHRDRFASGRATFDDLPDHARHLTRLGLFDELAGFALAASGRIAGELGVAAFLGEIVPTFPRDHSSMLALIDRECRALQSIGNSPAAAQRAGEMVELAQGWVEADPGNVERQRALTISYNRLADLAVTAGDAGSADELYRQSLAITQRLAEVDPANVERQRDLTISYNKLADLARAAGDAGTADELYREALDIRRRLAEADPANVQLQRDLTISYNKLADLARAAGDAGTADELYRQSLAITQRLAEADPANVERQRDLTISYDKLADLARAAGDAGTADELYRQSLAIARRLAEADPGNVELQRDLSVSYNKLADLARAAGDAGTADELYREALDIRRRQAEADPGNAQLQRDVAVSLERLGILAIDTGRLDAARKYLTGALEGWEDQMRRTPTDILSHHARSVAYDGLARIALATGDVGEARRLWLLGREIAQRSVATDPTNARYQRDVMYVERCLAELDAAGEATPA